MDAAELLPIVYGELRKLAAARLANERPGQTLTATALVHEAYLRLGHLVPRNEQPSPSGDRAYFFAAAAEAMRRILIERARQKRGAKRGGERKRIDLTDAIAAVEQSPDELLDLDAALTRLATEDPDAAEVVRLRLYAGLTVEEAALAMNQSRAAAYRHWTYARAWLNTALNEMENSTV